MDFTNSVDYITKYRLRESKVLEYLKKKYSKGSECAVSLVNGEIYQGLLEEFHINDLEMKCKVLPEKFVNYLIPIRDILVPGENDKECRKSSC